jgi:hypothetical protein
MVPYWNEGHRVHEEKESLIKAVTVNPSSLRFVEASSAMGQRRRKMAATKHKRRAKLSRKLAERLTDINAKRMEARLDAASTQKAAAAAGLARLSQTSFNIEKRTAEKCPAVFNREGVTIERIAKKVADKLDAKTTKFFSHQGTVLDSREVEDHATQLKAAELGIKALGGLKTDDDADSTEHQPKGHTVRVVVSDPETARGFAELFAPRGTTGIVVDMDAEVDQNVG